MGKYLQDVMLCRPQLYPKGLTDEKIKAYKADYGDTLQSVGYLDFLFNHHIKPNTHKTTNGIWRYIVYLNPTEDVIYKEQQYSTEVSTIEKRFDNHLLKSLKPIERNTQLLTYFTEGLVTLSKLSDFDEQVFIAIRDKIIADNFILEEIRKQPKISPNKKKKATTWAITNEEKSSIYLIINDLETGKESRITICESIKSFFEDLSLFPNIYLFDTIQWMDSETLHLYHVNPDQSYGQKKVSNDYFKINVTTQSVDYMPQTKQFIFNYGLKLFLASDTHYDEAMILLKKAQSMGHGKADNLFLNLKINPNNRDKRKLLQTPKLSEHL